MAILKNTLINDTGYLQLPVGTTAQRPASPSTPMVRFNSSLDQAEIYDSVAATWTTLNQLPYVTTNLVLNLDAGDTSSYGGSGVNWYDISGNNNNTSLAGGYSYGSSPRGYIQFGSGAYAYSTNVNNFNLPASNAITVEAWIYWSTFSTGSFQFYWSNSGPTPADYRCGISNGGGLYWNMGNRVDKSSATTPGSTGTWMQLVWVTSGSTTNIYKNGSVIVSNFADSGILRGINGWYLGCGETGISSYPFTGRISIFRQYSIALDANQVLQNYNAVKGLFGL